MVSFSDPGVLFITGANRGYGRALAERALSQLSSGSVLVLHSRAGNIEWVNNFESRQDIHIIQIAADLRDTGIDWEAEIDSKIPNRDNFNFALLFFNAGTCGDVTTIVVDSNYDSDLGAI